MTVSEPSRFAGEMCRAAGANNVIADGDLYSGTVKVTGARKYKPLLGPDILMGGFNRVYDTVGSSRTLNAGMRCMAAQGVLSQVGIGGKVRLDLTPLWLKMQTIKGVYGGSYQEYKGRHAHLFDITLDLLAEGKLDFSGLVTHKFTLEQYEEMIKVNLDKAGYRVFKTVVSFQ